VVGKSFGVAAALAECGTFDVSHDDEIRLRPMSAGALEDRNRRRRRDTRALGKVAKR
jgi:hypothetical protein